MINRCLGWFATLRRREAGATLVEYTFMMALIALACLAAVTALGGALVASFNRAISLFH